jgi:protein-tyrosine-phosphatase
MSEPHVFNVLFLCTGNSARSILAEAIMNREGMGKFKAYSAGSHPKGFVHPVAIDVLKIMNFNPEHYRSKDWDEFAKPDAPKLDFVFTLCDEAAAEVCPVWPGQPISAHWGMPDPARAAGSPAEVHQVFYDTARMLRNRISLFAALPIDKLDGLALKKKVDEIGKAMPE